MRGCRPPKGEADISVFTRLVFAAYFLEAGLILIVAPWSGFWDRNVFAQSELLAGLLASPFVRGAVSGIGIVTAVAGLAELSAVFLSRGRRAAGDSPDSLQP